MFRTERDALIEINEAYKAIRKKHGKDPVKDPKIPFLMSIPIMDLGAGILELLNIEPEARFKKIFESYGSRDDGLPSQSHADFMVWDDRVIGLNLFMFELEEIPEAISELKSLLWASFYGCSLNPAAARFDLLSDAKGLEVLNLETAFTRRAYPQRLSETIGTLTSLRYLRLHHNGLRYLPESFGNLTSLKTLLMYYNDLRALPESFGNLRALEELQLMGNRISELPESFGNLSSLKSIVLAHNSLSELPASIGNLSSLEDLSLGDNILSELPKSFGNLSSLLERLNISNNRLTDLPNCVGDLESLMYLRASGNRFTEFPEIVMSLAQFGNIEEIDLRQDPPILKGLDKGERLREKGIRVKMGGLIYP